MDRDLLLAELEELGIAAPTSVSSDGVALMAMLENARSQPQSSLPQFGVELAVFRQLP
jgi:hypothetical protein